MGDTFFGALSSKGRLQQAIKKLADRILALESTGGSGNIYTSDGTLQDDRVVTGDNKDLTFSGVKDFTVAANRVYLAVDGNSYIAAGDYLGSTHARLGHSPSNPVLIQGLQGASSYQLPTNSHAVGDIIQMGASNQLEFTNEWRKITVDTTTWGTSGNTGDAFVIYTFAAGEILEHALLNVDSIASSGPITFSCILTSSDYYGSTNAFLINQTFFGSGNTLPLTAPMDMVAMAYYQPVAPLGLTSWTLKIVMDTGDATTLNSITDGEISVYIKTKKLPGF